MEMQPEMQPETQPESQQKSQKMYEKSQINSEQSRVQLLIPCFCYDLLTFISDQCIISVIQVHLHCIFASSINSLSIFQRHFLL